MGKDFFIHTPQGRRNLSSSCVFSSIKVCDIRINLHSKPKNVLGEIPFPNPVRDKIHPMFFFPNILNNFSTEEVQGLAGLAMDPNFWFAFTIQSAIAPSSPSQFAAGRRPVLIRALSWGRRLLRNSSGVESVIRPREYSTICSFGVNLEGHSKWVAPMPRLSLQARPV